jgi:endonuclease/exonuclease/phosphatase (EEP) superfamily protein YafD
VHKHSSLTWLICGYVAFIAIWLLARAWVFDQVWPLALLNTVAEYLFLPLPVLLLLGLWLRQRASLLLSLPIVAFFLLFGNLFWPLLTTPTNLQPGALITVMSFNVLQRNRDYDAIVSSIQSASPDLIGFQELNPPSAQAIAQRLASEYPYGTLVNLERGQSAGLLSRFPLETAEWFSLPPRDIALHTTITMEGRRVHVFLVHLSPNNFNTATGITELIPLVVERYGRRAAEVNRLEAEIATLGEPVLLLCDCNLTDTSEAYARLNRFLSDSFREVGWGMGHTLHPPDLPFPVQRIDYVWHSAEFVALDAFVGQAGGSDHLPMVAKLKLVEMP